MKNHYQIDNRKDGKVEVVNVTVNNRKTKKSDGKKVVKRFRKFKNFTF